MLFGNIIFSIAEETAVIRFNRPKAYNALNSKVNAEILAALEVVEADKSVRVLIITGNEKAFAAGADIDEMSTAGPNQARKISSAAVLINDRIEALQIPVIAAVGGLAWGGGFELALACDFRIGGSKTSFKLPEVSLGIIPGANGTQRLIPLIGAAKTKELVMLCKEVRGEEALKLGILTRLVADSEIMNEAYNMAEELKAMPGLATAAAKRSINAGAANTIAQGKQIESAEFCMMFDTRDQKEGMAAFKEKRPPRFENK